MKFTGLTDQQVEESRKKHGSNEIPDSEPTTFWAEFLETFKDPMIKILLVIAALMIAMYVIGLVIGTKLVEIYEPIGTIVAILVVALVTAKTGVASDTKYRQLKDSQKKDTCKVYRNGELIVLDVDNVVVGDKVLLQSGDKIPADGILIDGGMSVDNSVLNGEAEECKKTSADEKFQMTEEITGDTFVDDHSLFRGAVVFDGEGVLDVRKVGLKTMMGRMAEEMQGEEVDSPLKVKLNKLAKQISTFGYIGATVITVLYILYFIFIAPIMVNDVNVAANSTGLLDHAGIFFQQDIMFIIKEFIEAVSLAVVIIVCAVPEGLPLMISLVLMQNTSKMLDHNVLVRKAEGIETAGSLNILFSDKTGTITKGILEVVEFFTADGKTIPLDEIKNHKTVNEDLLFAIGKNTQSMYDSAHEVIGGNITDRALMKFIGEEAFLRLEADKTNKVTASQSFNSANKFSQARIDNQGKTFYKGAPERLLAKATKYLDADGNIKPLDMKVLNEKIDSLSSKAMRVLSFGYSEKPLRENEINDDVVMIGLVGIRDDVRQEAKDAIHEVQQAGIQVVMITGDRVETALAIAKDAGLVTKETNRVLTSAQLNEMSDDEIKKIIPDIRVIARALPTDKSRMVRLCQELNLVVGMTGDGVNDSPALKKADVGFAMGSGTEAAKEAGKIVILDDNFRSIKDAILYGRTIYHNILKFCTFQLVINVAAVVVSALAPFFGVDEPLKVTHLLFVNLVMDSLGAIMLGNEPALPKYMKEKPRRRDESIISKKMAAQIGVMATWVIILSSVYFLVIPTVSGLQWANGFFANGSEMSSWGFQTPQLTTGYFVLFILAALFNGFNVRDDGFGIFKRLNENKNFLIVWFVIVFIQAAIVNMGLINFEGSPFVFISNMFSCTPFSWQGWCLIIVFAFTMIPVDLIRKAITKAVSKNKQ